MGPPSRRIVIAALAVAIAVAGAVGSTAIGAPPGNCHGTVTSSLSTFTLNGVKLTPSSIASRVPGTNAGDVNQTSGALCNAGVAPPQVAAQVLKNWTFTSAEIGLVLKGAFGQSAVQAAQILKNVGFSATEIANALKLAY